MSEGVLLTTFSSSNATEGQEVEQPSAFTSVNPDASAGGDDVVAFSEPSKSLSKGVVVVDDEKGATGVEKEGEQGDTKGDTPHSLTRQELAMDRAYQFYRRVVSKGKELIFYVIFMIFFTLATYYLRGDENVFYMSNRMKANLLNRDFGLDMGGEKTFLDVSDVRDIWLFIENPMTEFLYGLQLDVNTSNYGQDSLFYVNQHNRYVCVYVYCVEVYVQYYHMYTYICHLRLCRILGGIRVRQKRAPKFSCDYVNSDYDSLLTQCYDDVSENEDTESSLKENKGKSDV
jgi:hypothetical protein